MRRTVGHPVSLVCHVGDSGQDSGQGPKRDRSAPACARPLCALRARIAPLPACCTLSPLACQARCLPAATLGLAPIDSQLARMVQCRARARAHGPRPSTRPVRVRVRARAWGYVTRARSDLPHRNSATKLKLTYFMPSCSKLKWFPSSKRPPQVPPMLSHSLPTSV